MEDSDFNAARSRVSAEIKMFIFEVGEFGLDEDTAEFVRDGASRLITDLDQVVEDKQLDKIETRLGRLQVTVRQALRKNKP